MLAVANTADQDNTYLFVYLLAFIETVQTTMNKVQIDHDVEIGLRSLQRGMIILSCISCC